MPLDLHEHVQAPEERDELGQALGRTRLIAVREPPGQGPLDSAREAHQPVGVRLQVGEPDRGRALWRAQLHARHQATQVLIALAILDEQRQP